jgi:hypothetical protein
VRDVQVRGNAVGFERLGDQGDIRVVVDERHLHGGHARQHTA